MRRQKGTYDKLTLGHKQLYREHKESPTPDVPAYWRPKTRGDCIDGPRPCPFVGCRHHLFLDVNKNGGIRCNQRTASPDGLFKMQDTCSLDVADRGASSHYLIGSLLNLTHQGAQVLEAETLKKVRKFLKTFVEGADNAGSANQKKRRFLLAEDRPRGRRAAYKKRPTSY